MARTTGTVSMNDLIGKGKLMAGEPLIIRRRSATPIRGTLERDGSIRVRGSVYSTPSTAARNALGLRAANGWIRWRVPRLSDRTLEELRREVTDR